MKLVTIDPRRIELADYGVLHLAPRPGTNAAVMLGIAHVIHRDGLTKPDVHRARAPIGYETLLELLPQYTPEVVEEITGVPAADLVQAAHIYGEAENACFSWGLGVTEHKYGSEVVQLICNVALMTGNVGRLGAALLPLRGPEQRPGLARHGRAAGHLHRLPLGRRRGGRALFEARVGRRASRARRATRSRRCSTPRSPAT